MASSIWIIPNRLLKNGVSGRDPALRGSGECSHTGTYAALPPSPHALADGPILVFQQPAAYRVILGQIRVEDKGCRRRAAGPGRNRRTTLLREEMHR
jgi:hypothetical protein